MALPPPTSFDEFLERLLGGGEVDSESFVKAHPELSRAERTQLLRLCVKPMESDSAATSGASKPATAAEIPPVPSIGGFKLGKRIGAGGMGAVFLAEDESLGREIAVKILGPDFGGSGEQAERFLREVRAVARLRHPNIVTVHAAGEENGVRYMAMELIAGSSLHEVIVAAAAGGSRLPVSDVIRWGTEVAHALHAAHAAGIVHRDVKPSNIRISSTDGRAVLLDFGLAREAGAVTLTESGTFRGSPQYASPEQVGVINVPLDERSDVYSLGATLYEALTGLAPFRGQTREQLFHQILSREPVPLRRLDPSLPRDLETVVLATLDKDPARRHPTAAALAADLEAVRDGRPPSVRPPSRIGRLARWAKRQPAKAALLVSLVIAVPLVGGLGGFILANLSKIRSAAAGERALQLAHILEDGFVEYGEGTDASLARSVFEDALRIDPGAAEAKAGFALACIAQGDSRGAIAFLDGLTGDAGAAWSVAVRSVASRRLGRVTENLTSRPSPALTAIDHFVLGIIGLDRVHAGEMKAASEAFEHLQEAVLSAPAPNALYHRELGHAAWHAGRHRDARIIAAAIERQWPESPERWYAVGRTLLDADRRAALDAFLKAARGSPRAPNLRIFIARILGEHGEEPERAQAISLARETVGRDPLRAGAHAVLGVLLLLDQQIEQAIVPLREAVRLDPKNAAAHRTLAQALFRGKQVSQALAPAREAVRLSPDAYQSWGYLGFILVELGQIEEAITSYERAVKLNPQGATLLCNLGLAYFKNGEFGSALERVTKGHEIGSKDPRWKDRSTDWIPEIESRVLMESRLADVRIGAGDPPTPDEKLSLARMVCTPKQLFTEATQLYSEAFDVDPTLKSQSERQYLREAAGCAVTAGLGDGRDEPADAAARKRLLALGRSWIIEEVEAIEHQVRQRLPRAAAAVAGLRSWIPNRAVAATRLLAAGEVGDAETASWQALWARIDALVVSK